MIIYLYHIFDIGIGKTVCLLLIFYWKFKLEMVINNIYTGKSEISPQKYEISDMICSIKDQRKITAIFIAIINFSLAFNLKSK